MFRTQRLVACVTRSSFPPNSSHRTRSAPEDAHAPAHLHIPDQGAKERGGLGAGLDVDVLMHAAQHKRSNDKVVQLRHGEPGNVPKRHGRGQDGEGLEGVVVRCLMRCVSAKGRNTACIVASDRCIGRNTA